MAFRHVRTSDAHNPAHDSRARLLQRLLARHAADGFDVLELRQQMGKSGYVPTEHRWEDDGGGDDLSDDEGGVLLIGGMSPADLASELIDTARQHVEEAGTRKNFRIVALRQSEGEDGEDDQEEVFQLLLPATLFGAMPDTHAGSESHEHHDALMAANQQLQRQNDGLFRMLMDVVRQYPTVLGKSTELLEQLGDQLGGGRQHDLQQVLAILEFESSRDMRWMDHDRAKQRADHRADLAGKAVDVAGPDLMTLVRRMGEMVMDGATLDPDSSPKTSQSTDQDSPSTSAFATRLDEALGTVPKEGIAKARMLLSEDEWTLIESARAAEADDEFGALFAKLEELWTARGKAATQTLMTQLIDALGMKPAMVLGQLIREAREL